ncbi:MAG: SDR family NAD(P)-dependent oxidoreductase [Candidatus Glassbacteria bacterium]
MSGNLSGKSCLITGAAGAIGREIAKQLALCDARLFLTSRRKGELSKLSEEIREVSSSVSTHVCDLRELGEIEELCERAVDAFGVFDFLVNAAGVGKFAQVTELDPADLIDLLQVNLIAPFTIIRRFLPGMIERGSGAVVNISSIAGVYGYPYCSAYGASKAALIGLSRSLREELMPRGIRVFTVCPSSVDTPFMNNVPKQIPREKMLKPEDVASVVVRLLSHPERVVEEEIVLKPMAYRPYI